MPSGAADLDIGGKPRPGALRGPQRRTQFAAELEDFFGAGRVDLALLPEAAPFLAAAYKAWPQANLRLLDETL